MSKFLLILFILILVALGGGAVFLATWDIPPPSEPVEKVIPDERFPLNQSIARSFSAAFLLPWGH